MRRAASNRSRRRPDGTASARIGRRRRRRCSGMSGADLTARPADHPAIFTGTHYRNAYENHHHRHGLCRPRDGRVSCRNRQRRVLSRRRSAQDRRSSTTAACRSTSRACRKSSRAPARPAASQFSTDVEASVAHGEIQFIAVGTPPDEDGSADLQYVLAAARNIGRHMNGFKVIVDKSTVPVGTALRVREVIEEELADARARCASSTVFGGVEPGVPEGRRGGRRLHAPRPHRARLRRRRSRRIARAN